jgi:NlpC/P60 family putative phage cell wall peptidase
MNGDPVVVAARAWLGTPYRHRASTLGAGCDCLGLLRGVWRALYGEEPMAVPAYRADWRGAGEDGALRRAAEALLTPAEGPLAPGQVVLFRLGGLNEPRHCGIMISDRRFIHAQEHLGVVEANLTPGWSKRVSGRFQFP